MTGRWVGMKPYTFLTSHALTWLVANRQSSIQRHKNLEIRPKSKQFVFCWSVWIKKDFAKKNDISYSFAVRLQCQALHHLQKRIFWVGPPLASHPATWAVINEIGTYRSLCIAIHSNSRSSLIRGNPEEVGSCSICFHLLGCEFILQDKSRELAFIEIILRWCDTKCTNLT